MLKDGTHTFPVKMLGGRVGKTPPKHLRLKDQKSQAALLKQTRPKPIGFPGAFGVQVKTNGTIDFKTTRALVVKAAC